MNGTVMEFRLRRPPFFTTRFAINSALLVLVGWWLASGIAGYVEAVPQILVQVLVFGAAMVAVVAMLVIRALNYRLPPAPIRLRPDGIELPRRIGDHRSYVASWKDIHTLELRGTTERILLLLGTKRRTYVLPGELFDRPDGPAVLHAAIVEQLVRQPGGTEVLDAMRRGREAMRALVETRPRVTHAILISLFVAYGIQIVADDPADPSGLTTLIRLGGNVASLVKEGQIDRLITASWLHAPLSQPGGFMHIGLNALGIWMLGGLMERLLGPTRYFVVYVLSAIAGAAASTWGSGAAVSVGASTALLGLFGALAVVHLVHLRSIPPAVRQPTRWWIVIIGINLVIGLAVPNIDHWGHGGGLAAGMAATLLLTLRWPPLDPAPRKDRLLRPLAYALLAVTISGLAWSGYRAAFGGPADLTVLGRQMMEDPDADPVMLNNHAYMIAISPDATREQLEMALAMAQRAHDQQPNDAYIMDTLGQVQWRLGNVDEAIDLARRSLGAEPNAQLRSMYATQLARFLEKRVKDTGPITIGENVPALTVDVRNDVLHVEMDGEPPRTGLVAYVVVERGDPLPWLLELRLGPDRRPPETYELDESWPEGMRAHVALVDTTVEVPRGVDFRVSEYPPDDDVAGIP